MNFEEWEPIYKKILADFSFSEAEDRRSADLLEQLLNKHPHVLLLSSLSSIVEEKSVYIIGASTQVEEMVVHYKQDLLDHICICADGATTALLNQSIIPDIIVSDLDGNIHDQIYANEKGSILVVHAHGANKEIIEKVVPLIPNMIIGTTQTDPSCFLFVNNVGGFTDGDRAVFLADHLNARSIFLLGFDFHGPIGDVSDPSKSKNLALKKKKLLWAEKLIFDLQKKDHIYFLK